METIATVTAPASDPRWSDAALCAQTDPEAFFPERGAPSKDAKRICNSCDVEAECLAFALANDERYGIWGGKSAIERARLRAAAKAGSSR